MFQEFPPNHPFPYFGLRVTRDLGKIAQAVQKKFEIEKDFQNKIGETHRYSSFCKTVTLIAHPAGKGTGNYPLDSAKINKIVDLCLARLDPDLRKMARGEPPTIHPDQYEYLLKSAEESNGIERALADDYLQQAMRKYGIKLDKTIRPPDPPTPPRPVTDVKFELGDRKIRLLWTKPSSHCEKVLIHRQDWPPARQVPVDGSEWTDSEVQPGVKYTYTISSVFGAAPPGGTISKQIVPRGSVEGFSAQLKAGKVELRWKPLAHAQKVTVLRARKTSEVIHPVNGTFQLPGGELKQVPLDVKSAQFVDDTIAPQQTFCYLILVHHLDNVCSASEWHSVTLPEPPEPPTKGKIEVSVLPGVIHLSWESSGPRVSYRVARGESAALTGDAQHERGWHLTTPTLEDKEVVPGVSYWYFMACEIDEVVSPSVSVGPLVAIGEVSKLRATPGSRQIDLEWEAPKLAKRVEVLRAEGRAPDDPRDPSTPPWPGVAVPVTSSGAIDAGLKSDVIYHYRVMCVYRTPSGSEVRTPGETVFAVVREVPVAVRNIRAAYEGGLKIEWENPGRAIVQVVRNSKMPSTMPAGAVPLDQIKQFGAPLPHVTETGIHVLDPPAGEPYYFIFATNRHQAVYCGRALYWEASELRATADGFNLLVNWRWPEECAAAALTHLPPGASTPRSQTVQCGRGATILSAREPGEHRLSVSCLPPEKGAQVAIGPAQQASITIGGATSLAWRLVRPYSMFKKLPATAVVVTPNGALSAVGLRLIAQGGRIPKALHDGEPLAEWSSATNVSDQPLELPLRAWSGAKNQPVYCRLFAEPGSIKVIPPESYDDMKL